MVTFILLLIPLKILDIIPKFIFIIIEIKINIFLLDIRMENQKMKFTLSEMMGKEFQNL